MALICLLFLFSVRSSIVAITVIPLAVLLAFIPMSYLGMTINIMSLAGVALAVGDLVDAGIVMVENALKSITEET